VPPLKTRFSQRELSLEKSLNLDIMRKSDWLEYEKYLLKAPIKMASIYKIIKKHVDR